MESIPEFENLLLKPKEKNEKVSTLLYKPEETNLAPVKYSNTSAEPTREDSTGDKASQEGTKQQDAKQESPNDPRRYVGEKPTDIHVAPGKDSTVKNRLPGGTEVLFTGRKTKDKNGEYWAEIECRGQRGWVVANDLRVTNPNPQKTTTVSVKDETENTPVTSSGATNSSGQTQGTQEQGQPKQETRKVSDGPLNMRSEPGMKTEVIEKLPKGTEVTYTGKITEEKDGHVWAEVTYDGKTGWVAVEYLEEIEEKEPEDEKDGEVKNSKRPPTMYELYYDSDKENEIGLKSPFEILQDNLPKFNAEKFEQKFTYEELLNGLNQNDIDAGITITESPEGDSTYYYDYTTVIMNRVNEALPEFDKHRILPYLDYVNKYSIRLFGVIPTFTPTFDDYWPAVFDSLLFFYDQVNHEEDWDIKVDKSWKDQFGAIRMPYYKGDGEKEKFIFRGELVTREDLGNILYGYLGSAMGIGEITLFWGGGVAKQGIKNVLSDVVRDSTNNYGDDETDHINIQKGIDMYYEDYPDAKAGINCTFP